MTDTYAPNDAEVTELEEVLDEMLAGDPDDNADSGDLFNLGPVSRIVGSFDTREEAEYWVAEQAKTGVDASRYVIVDDGICFNVEDKQN
jgi:hypothetical protein